MKRFNTEKYNNTINSLLEIKKNIADSDHDRTYVDPDSDFEPILEEVENWLTTMNLPAPSDVKHSIVYELPFEYWTDIFGQTDDAHTCLSKEEEIEIVNSKPYRELFKLYSSVYEDLYEAVKEESAYYQNEYEAEQKYYKSMRRF